MSNVKSRSKSSLFLMELILVIMFFSISAAICMKVFASAKVKTDYSRNISNASFVAETIAENFKEYDGNLIKLSDKFSGDAEGDILVIYYDSEWKPCKKGAETFILTLERRSEKYVETGKININSAKGDDIFELVVADATNIK